MSVVAAQPKPSTGRWVWRLLQLAWRFRRLAGLVLLCNGLLVAFNLGGLGFVGLGIDVLRAALVPSAPAAHWPAGWSPPASWTTLQTMWLVSGLVLATATLHAGLKVFTAAASAWLSQAMVIALRAEVYDKLQRLSFRFFDDHDSSAIIGRVAGDVQAVRAFIDGVVLKVLTVLLSLGVALVYMVALHGPLTAACLATSPLLIVGALWFSRSVRGLYARSSELGDRVISVLAENAQGMSVVKAFAQESAQREKFAAANEALRDQKSEIFRRLSTYQPLMGLLTQVNQLVLIGYGGWLVVRGELPLGAGMFVFANLIQEFAGQVGQIINIANTIQSSLTAAERVFEVLDAPVEITDAADARPLPRAQGAIVFEDVSFGYVPDRPVLQHISFSIAPGERIGITGPTGAGKSTLLALLARFYDVDAGRVLLDGADLRSWRLNDVRRNLGLVFQESFLFSNSVAANIAFGDPTATQARIEAAAELSAAAEFIAALPDRYDNLVGEHGVTLSGGQRQRLALARALLVDPPILLLDDATAAVDAGTESAIREALAAEATRRTVIQVSGRVSTLQHVDRILVLEGGRIVQTGTPQELLREPGLFQTMARLQADAMLDDAAEGSPA